MSAQPHSLTDRVLAGRYRVGGLLGRGGMGVVCEALDERLGRRVALKVLHPHLTEDADLVARFRREARAAGSLGHPNIVQVSDFDRDADGTVFLVMELLPGMPLSDAIAAEGRLAPDRVAAIAIQVLSALAAAHGAGIVHRDLKPDNVFLVPVAGVGEVAKLLDFGIAKLRDGAVHARLTATGAVLGTPVYMSPEQARGRVVDARADLYGVGAVMYEALAGRLPFTADNYNALLVALLEEAPTPLASLRPELDPGLVAVVERAMAKDPAARFASADEMAQALAPFVRGSARPPTLASRPLVATRAATTPALHTGWPEGAYVARSAIDPTRPPPSARRGIALAALVGSSLALGVGIVLAVQARGRAPAPTAAPSPSWRTLESHAPGATAPMPSVVALGAPAATAAAPGESAKPPRAPAPPTPPAPSERSARAVHTRSDGRSHASPARSAPPVPPVATLPTTEASEEPPVPGRGGVPHRVVPCFGRTTGPYSVDAQQWTAMLAPVFARLGRCASRADYREVGPRENYIVQITVDGTGRVVGPAVWPGEGSSNGQPAAVADCMLAAFRGANLGPPPGGAGGEIVVQYCARVATE